MTERLDIVVSERGAKTVSRKISDVGKSATTSEKAVKLLRRSLGLLGGALILGSTIRTLANFSQEMSTVRAVTQATGEQFTALREKAKELGATTRFSATQAAEGMTFLARAGFNANEVLASVGDTLNLAQAGALALGDAADIASNVLKGFNLEATDTTRVVDVLTLTANKSNTNIKQLGDAMSFLAPAAAAVGVSVEQASASVGALSDAGVQATRAGTSMRQIFIKLLDVTPKARKAMDALGVSAADLNVEQRGLVPVLETLRKSNLGLTDAAALVGARQAANLLILTKSIPKIKELTAANEGAAGTAAKVAKIMDENLNGALFAVKSAFEAVIIAIGDFGAESVLTSGFRSLASALRFVASNMDDVAAAAKVLALGFVAMKLPVVIAQMKTLRLVLLTNPLGLMATAASALAVILIGLTATVTLLRDQIKLTADGTLTLGDVMKGASVTLGKTMVDAVNALGGSFADFDALAARVLRNFGQVLTLLLATTNGAVQGMLALFETLPRLFRNIWAVAWNAVLAVTTQALNNLVRKINVVLTALGQKKIELFDLSKLALEGEVGGETIGQAFERGFTATLQASLQASAERRAAEAATAAKAKIDKELADLAKVSNAGGPAGAPVKREDGAFKKLLDDLRLEGELLLLNNRERAVREAILASEDQLNRKLTDSESAKVAKLVEGNLALADQNALLNEIQGPQQQYADRVAAIEGLLKRQAISQEEANVKTRDAKIALLDTQTSVSAGFERGFLKAQAQMEDFATSSERLITDAFSEAQDAVVGFFETGEFSADKFFKSIASNLIKLGVQQAFSAAFSGGGGGGGGGFGGGGGTGGFNIGGLVSSLIGFQNGGTFTVGAGTSASPLTGVDNRLIAFRAQDGEKVSITPRNASGARDAPINQVFNVTTPDADSFRRSQTQLQNRAAAGLSRARSRR